MDPRPSVAVVYGSSFGDTARAAQRIADLLRRRLGQVVPCLDVADVDLDRLRGLDLLVAGTSTWHGGEPQDDWADALPRVVATLDWSGTCVALFGLGERWCDAVLAEVRATKGWHSAGASHR